jgi:hypothetical protein
LLATEQALNEFKDELSRHTEELIVQKNRTDKHLERLGIRLEHVEEMLEAFLRGHMAASLKTAPGIGSGLEPLPPMRDKMPTADEVEEAVERGVEKALKTPATAFQIPGLPGTLGINPWAPPPPVSTPSERVREVIKVDKADEIIAKEKARGDFWRGVASLAIGTVAATGLGGLIYLIAKAIVGPR